VSRPGPHRALLRDLKAVQDSLGAFQDAEIHRDRVRASAVALHAAGAGVPTLLAMGELVARLDAAQRLAAAAAAERVGSLVTETNRRRAADLVRPA
jgi:CHAD domain-containing protein